MCMGDPSHQAAAPGQAECVAFTRAKCPAGQFASLPELPGLDKECTACLADHYRYVCPFCRP